MPNVNVARVANDTNAPRAYDEPIWSDGIALDANVPPGTLEVVLAVFSRVVLCSNRSTT